MKHYLYSLLFILPTQLFYSQEKRWMLVEEFTQASCGPCALVEEKRSDISTEDHLIRLRYHTLWPGYDPMAVACSDEVKARLTTYQPTGIPKIFVNGNAFSGHPSQLSSYQQSLKNKASSPFSISLHYTYTANMDSVLVHGTITCARALKIFPAHLQIALIEKEINFATAPGTNGKTKFNQVVRKLLPDARGTILPLSWNNINAWDFCLSEKIPSGIYTKDELALVAWMQSDESLEVLQAAYTDKADLLPNEVCVLKRSTALADPTASSITLVPSLVNDFLRLQLSGETVQQASRILITNALGQVVYTQTITATETPYNISIPVNQWVKGIYYLSVEGTSPITPKKFIVY